MLGVERLELPTTYAGIKDGEEKMARKVLRHLRSRDGKELVVTHAVLLIDIQYTS